MKLQNAFCVQCNSVRIVRDGVVFARHLHVMRVYTVVKIATIGRVIALLIQRVLHLHAENACVKHAQKTDAENVTIVTNNSGDYIFE